MVYSFCGVKIYYSLVGKVQKVPTVMLHGWGCDSTIFSPLVSFMPDKYFLLVDFPPFGKSNVEPKDWNIFTYANAISSLCEKLGFENINVVGHSFGGRVAIILSALKGELVQKCTLIDSAGLKPRRGLRYYTRVYYYKLAKKFGYVVDGGSQDFKALSTDMKKVFISVVNQHLEQYLPLINQPTLILQGALDKEVPLAQAKKLNKNIKNSTLKVLPGCGHFPFLDNMLSCYRLIDNFLEEK